MMKKKTAFSLMALTVALTTVLSACGSSDGANKPGNTPSNTNTSGETKQVTLRFFSNLPDRKSGQGLAEQTVIDNYVKANPNVKIDVEALAEEPFKNKLKAYMASNEPIDITMVHNGAELDTLVAAGYVTELNPKDYEGEKYNFLPGVFTGFTFNDKIYGLPRNSDYSVIYYNKALFQDNGIKVPTTVDELMAAAKAFQEKKIEPISMNGKDLWNIGAMFQNLHQRISGEQTSLKEAAKGQKKFADDPYVIEAAALLQQMVKDGIYNKAYMTMDYGASQNLFTQGKAAMWYMGSWEAGMASNESLPQAFRDNLGVIRFPVANGGKGGINDLIAWNGGGYSLVEASKNKEEAKKFFDFMMSADQWAKVAWDTGAAVPAQKYELTGKETEVQKELANILLEATSTTGILLIDASTASFKDAAQTALGKLAIGNITPEEFAAELDKAASKK
jgi:raffinose/stachyose/melibiose transport system substrate-binding protein